MKKLMLMLLLIPYLARADGVIYTDTLYVKNLICAVEEAKSIPEVDLILNSNNAGIDSVSASLSTFGMLGFASKARKLIYIRRQIVDSFTHPFYIPQLKYQFDKIKAEVYAEASVL